MWSAQEYEALVLVDGCHPDLWCDLAVCYVYLGMYKEAHDAAAKGVHVTVGYGSLCWVMSGGCLSLQLPKGGHRTDLCFTWRTR